MLDVHDRTYTKTNTQKSKTQRTAKGGKFKAPADKLIDISTDRIDEDSKKETNVWTPKISSTPATPNTPLFNGKVPSTPATPSTPSMFNVSLKSSNSQFQAGQKPQERKVAEGKLMYDIIKYLKEKIEHEFTCQELYTATNIDIKSNIELQKSLQQNIKIRFEDDKYSYKPKHEIKSKEDVFEVVIKSIDGVDMDELKDSNKKIEEFVTQLTTEKKILRIKNSETNNYILYPNDPAYKMDVCAEFKQFWFNTRVPVDDNDLKREMRTIGLTPTQQASDELKEKRSNERRQKKKRKRIVKLHNTHVFGLELQTMDM